MNAPVTDLAEACRGALEREKAALKEAEEARRERDFDRVREAVRDARVLDNGIRLIGLSLSSPDIASLSARALELCKDGGRVCIFLAPRGNALAAAIAASQDVPVDLRPLFKVPGARGGGRDRFVTGQFLTDAPAEVFLQQMTERVRELLQGASFTAG